MTALSLSLERRGPFGAMGISSRPATRAELAVKPDIELGLAGNEFVPFFQPQVDATTGRLLGLEVLARWHRPGFGILSPRSFLDLAAASGKLNQIEEQVLDNVQAQLARWERWGFVIPKVSLNCTAQRLSCDRFLDRAAALGKHAASVALEVLETVSFEEAGPDLLKRIRSARKRGLQIEVDDFGAGAASIAGAMALQPDTLKIDRTLVKGIHNNRRRRDILRSIIAIAETLNARLIAEGVQMVEEASALVDLGVTSHQGYFHAPPLSGADVLDWMRDRLA